MKARYLGIILGVTLILGACGGGGGDGGATAAYTGNRALADVTVANGNTLANGGLGASKSVGGVVNVTARPQAEVSAEPNGSFILGTINVITNVVNHSLGKTASRASSQARTESGTINCSLGGSIHFSLDIPDSGNNFSGYMDFNGCTEAGIAIDGRVDISGTVAGDTMGSLTLTISNSSPLVITSGGDSVTFIGTLAMQINGATTTTVTNLLVINGDGRVEMLENFTVVFTDGQGGNDSLAISGRYYHPVEGYVEITTPVTMLMRPFDVWPFFGTMLLTGSAGSIAQIDIINNAQYTLSIDEDGDGNWESSEVINF
ncbi:MAG: hypothetical protein JMN24_01590 [gamma proteobacterium endosymbiont of Lamellibrachia anaximandri]|nr:hypothetical protein [gamma proteobacterium endosymbiont of Lamellibrachia anaximandri]MBL3617955.1 hypothetical protein [gamma proteobacterium endosymbiont of Lamellibrachia anaximandri]